VVGGETSLLAGGGEPLAVTDGGARMTGGGSIGTSGAAGEGGGEPLAIAPGSLHHMLRPPQWHLAAGGEAWSVADAGGLCESGRAAEF
jgi:hypothetical protein